MTATRRAAVAAVILWAATLAVFWPGYALYDSVAQYRQASSGSFDDWHPPAMAALWRLAWLTVGGGAGPMLAVQLGGWWLGLGLIAAGLARRAQPRAGAAVLAIGLLPPLIGWQVAVLKDAQLAGALVAATGLVAWWRLRAQAMPWPARLCVGILLAYAMLVRANAVFAVAPLVAGLMRGAGAGRRLTLGALVAAVGLCAMGPVGHGLLGATRSGVERTQPIYDLAGIAVRTTAVVPAMTAAERDAIIAKGCASPYFWDPLGDATRCGDDLAALHAVSPTRLYRDLARAVAAHPFAYAAHRAAHLNSTERWLVPWRWPGAEPPTGGEPNPLGLTDPGGVAAAAWQALGGWVVETPLGWPVCWVVVALGALAAAWPGASGARSLAVALALSALAMEASFAVVSIASDLRYHLWPMTASALAAVLVLADGGQSRRAWRTCAILLALVVATGLVARTRLPLPPQTYAAMLSWR